MDFSLPTLFVVPVGNTLPTTGSTQDLTDGQFGIFKEGYAVATAANASTSKYLQFFQGRPNTGLDTKRSDKVQAAKIKEYYKVVGHPTALNEIWQIGGLAAKCGQTVNFTVVGHSNYIDMTSFNGLTQSVSVEMADCTGSNATIANETVIDAILAKINSTSTAQDPAGNALNITSYYTFAKVGTGDTAVITVTGKPLTHTSYTPADIATRNVDKDRLWFNIFAYTSPAENSDFYTDKLEFGTKTLNQRSTFATGSSEEIKMMETDFYSYQATFKHLFRNTGFNGQFNSRVVDGTTYDVYFIKFDELNSDSQAWASAQKIDERVIIAIPQGGGLATGIEAILSPYFGAVTDASGSTTAISPLVEP